MDWLEALALTAQTYAALATLVGHEADRTVLPLVTLVVWADAIYHLRGFQSLSALLTQISGIVQASLPFLFVFVLGLIGS